MPVSPTEEPGRLDATRSDASEPEILRDYAVVALEVLSEGVITQLASGRIVTCNPAAERLLGLTRDQIAGKTSLDAVWDVVHEDGSPFPGDTHPSMVTLATGCPQRDVVMGVHRPDGSFVWVSINTVPIPGPDGRPSAVVITFSDITERKREAERIVNERESFRRGFENSGEAIVLSGPGGSIVAANPAACRLFGRTEAEIGQIGRGGLVDPSDSRLPEALAERSRTGVFRGELNYVRSDGSIFPGEVTSVSYADASGSTWMCTNVCDISGRRRAEEALRKSEEDLRYVFEHSVVGASMTLPSGEVRVNEGFVKMLGYAVGEFEGRRWQDFTHPDDVEESRKHVALLLSGQQESFHLTKRYVRKDGSVMWAEVWTSLRRDAAGAPIFFVTSVIDITERKRAEEVLRQSEEKYRLIVESTRDGIWMIDAETRTTFANKRMAEMLGFTPEEMLGRPLAAFMADEEQEKASQNVERRERGISEEHDFRFRKKDGSDVWTMLSTHPLLSPEGTYVGAFATVTDISERKAAETTLQRQATMLAVAQEGAGAGLWQWDFATNHHAWAPELFRLFGLDPEKDESNVETWGRLLHPEDKEAAEGRFEAAVSQNTFLDSEYRIVRPDGEVRWIQAIGRLHCGPAGEPLWMAGLCVDITSRKGTEEELAESRQLLLDITDNSMALMYIVDTEGRFLLANRRLSDLLGVPERELLGQKRSALMPAEVAESHRANDLEVIRDRSPRMFEESNAEADGTHTYLTLKYPLSHRDGTIYAVGGMSTDITERKRAEAEVRKLADDLERRVNERTEELRQAMAYNRSLIEASLDPLVTVGQNGRILDVNEATVRATGNPREELLGADFSEFFTDADKAREGYQRAFLEGTVRNLELRLRRRDGTTIPVEYNATVYRDSAGVVQGVFAAARDLSVRDQYEAELAEANRELESFSYSVSHDLRAPLRAIEGFAGLLVRDGREHLTAEEQRLLDVVRANARKMSALIDDLLTFSRTGRHEIRRERLAMAAIAQAAFDEVSGSSEARNRIDFRLGDLPDAEGDPSLLRQVWINLLSNAVKFSALRERPVVEVLGTVDGRLIAYHVRDNGAGFDPAYVGKLFGVFQRLHKATEFEGTGIGLALVQRIVSRHGGRVWAEGALGTGATFSFSLPAGRSPGSRPER